MRGTTFGYVHVLDWHSVSIALPSRMLALLQRAAGRTGRRPAAAIITLLLAAVPVAAADLADFNAAVARADGHYRGAFFYFHTDNPGIAAVELAEMTAVWTGLTKRFRDAPPDAFADDPQWRAVLDDITVRLTQGRAAAEAGDTEAARTALGPIRQQLADLRQRNNIRVFSDDVDDLNAAMQALWPYRTSPPDFASAAAMNQAKAQIAVVEYLLRRCRDRAPDSIRHSEEFDRLIGGSLEGMERLRQAISEADRELFAYTVRELRSFNRMIYLRFG